MLGGFSLGEPFSGTTQRVSYDEQEYRHHGSLLYASNSHHPPTPSLERTRFFHVQHPFYTTSPHSQDSLYSDEASGQMSPIGDNSLPFLTDGGYGTNGTGLGICSVGSLLDQWNFRNSTPSSPFASPPIETPSPLHSNLSPLLSSPFNSPLNIMPHGSLSPLAISNGTVSSKLTSKDNLISHTDAHQGLKRFVCNYCDRRFRTRSVLARHQKSKICPASKLPQSKRKERSSFVCP
ncbi:hypothetical protein BDZ94DRAFT_172831 [Collybia nuda]|uniref:C2H2-type domain-containing protein n=1 Tax=Collybia nuda TaxID=64659 RepID=A0A9P6CHS4_9AGAR|nr:hypothetical protein BDZ94DRAFT_172831 [Collybia nuda]